VSYTALYRKYRPETFSDVVGQEHITEILKSELASGKIFHAYLFTGTRGTGKTSCAKILAKAVNCLSLKDGDPCCECESCRAISNGEVMDIVEIDAASNNGVDNIRTLREQVNFTPASAKYRVYIIDEVHMLTLGAFNALLKTLEEPPKHVVFVLATTEVHKLPATILSRCQRFDFKRIEQEKICERIKYIASLENFTITDEAASMIATIADGGMRDALSILDLCVSAGSEITEEVVASSCGIAGNEYLISLADYIKNQDIEKALLLTDKLYNSSVDMLRLLDNLISHYRNLLMIKTVRSEKLPIICSSKHLENLRIQANYYDIKDIMATLRLLQDTTAKMQNGNRRSEMELMLIKLCSPELRSDTEALEARITALEKKISSGIVVSNQAEAAVFAEPKAEKIEEAPIIDITEEEIPEPTIIEPPVIEEPIQQPSSSAAPIEKSDTQATRVASETWADILSVLSITAPMLSGILHDSAAYIENGRFLIDSSNAQFFDLMRSETVDYKGKLKRSIEEVMGRSYPIGPYTKKSTEENDPLQNLRDKLKFLEVPKRS